MFEQIILNASPLIILGKADLLTMLSPLSRHWLIPEGVIREIERKRGAESYLTALAVQLNVLRHTVSAIHPAVAAWDLGQGESEVLTLALRTAAAAVVLDDLQARKCATTLNMTLLGSLGLLLAAKRAGLIPLAKPAIERVRAAGLYVTPDILTQLLRGVGE